MEICLVLMRAICIPCQTCNALTGTVRNVKIKEPYTRTPAALGGGGGNGGNRSSAFRK